MLPVTTNVHLSIPLLDAKPETVGPGALAKVLHTLMTDREVDELRLSSKVDRVLTSKKSRPRFLRDDGGEECTFRYINMRKALSIQ